MVDNADTDLLTKIDGLLQQSQSLKDTKAKELVEETVRALMDLHGQALSKMMDQLAEHDDASEIMNRLAEDTSVSGLLLVYNLHPHPLETRVQAALDSVSPYLKSHGGSVKLLGITDEGAVHLQMQGSCHGCPSSAVTLKTSIEKAIYEKAPDISAIVVEGLEEESATAEQTAHVHTSNHQSIDGFVPIERLIASGTRLSLQAEAGTSEESKLSGAAL